MRLLKVLVFESIHSIPRDSQHGGKLLVRVVATALPKALYAYTMLNVLQTDCNLCMMTDYFLLFNNSKYFWVGEVGGRGVCVGGIIPTGGVWVWW